MSYTLFWLLWEEAEQRTLAIRHQRLLSMEMADGVKRGSKVEK